jgi:hypothetical protein
MGGEDNGFLRILMKDAPADNMSGAGSLREDRRLTRKFAFNNNKKTETDKNVSKLRCPQENKDQKLGSAHSSDGLRPG